MECNALQWCGGGMSPHWAITATITRQKSFFLQISQRHCQCARRARQATDDDDNSVGERKNFSNDDHGILIMFEIPFHAVSELEFFFRSRLYLHCRREKFSSHHDEKVSSVKNFQVSGTIVSRQEMAMVIVALLMKSLFTTRSGKWWYLLRIHRIACAYNRKKSFSTPPGRRVSYSWKSLVYNFFMSNFYTSHDIIWNDVLVCSSAKIKIVSHKLLFSSDDRTARAYPILSISFRNSQFQK